MPSLTASKWIITMDYCTKIKRTKWAIEANRRAIENQRERLGIKGRAILDQVSGTKRTDNLEASVIDAIENIERISSNLALFEADYTELIKPLERLPIEDQLIITARFIDEPKPSKAKSRPQKRGRVGSIDQEMAQVMAPYRALERLYDQLPEELKDAIPKAI